MTEDQTWNKLRHGFLTFNSMPPRVHVLSDDTEFDRVFLKHLRQEGFDVNYLPFTGDVKGFKWTIQHLADDLELGQSYAIIGMYTPKSLHISDSKYCSLYRVFC